MGDTDDRMAGDGDSTRLREDPSLGAADVDVLLVDDDETWVQSTAEVLEHQREAFAVETATDLATASDRFVERRPDCVVCDYDLEAGTGMDLLAEIRERDEERPFILVTGQGNESVASEAIGHRVTDYIPKRSLGGRGDLLARRIETAVETYRTRRALARERRSKDAMLDILTAAPSREGLAREFCRHLVGERGYECAWIGTLGGSRGLLPNAIAGEEGYVDAVVDPGTIPSSGVDPALQAVRSQSTRTARKIGAGGEDWETVAAEYGFGSAAAVPISHDGTTYGVLAVYSSTERIDDAELELLEEYADTIGYALRSAEWRESLLSASAVRIEVELTDESVPLVAIQRRLPPDSRIDILTTVVRDDGLLYVLRVVDAAAADLRESTRGIDAVQQVTFGGTGPGQPTRCDLAVSLPTPGAIVAENGGRVVATTVEHGRARMEAVIPEQNDVETMVSAIRSEYPDAGIRSVRSARAGNGHATVANLESSLTERQRTAAEMAFYNGYFRRPREHNATEVAKKLGVSRQTFAQHLRAAERKLFEVLFEK